MKRISIAVILIVAMIGTLTLTACSGASGGAASGDKKIKVGLSMGEVDQWLSILESAVKKGADERGYEFSAQDAQKDVQRQIDQVQTFASQGFDAIIVVTVDNTTADAIIQAAAGVPLVFVNRAVDESVLIEGKVVEVASDELLSGGFQGEFLSGYFADKEDKTLDVAILQGIMGHQSTIKRTDSVIKGLEDSGFTVNEVFKDTAEFDRAKAMQVVQTWLGTSKHLDVIISNNDEMALGAIEALKAVGKTTKDIPVVGIDGSGEGVASIAAGDLNASVFQDAAGQGEGALNAAADLIEGKDTEKVIYVPWELITTDNYKDFQ
ncbi:MAG: substrate-binding domain-containing protein [Clostridiales Family XIII bacterium]|nr:substrate-binding domain-containing protein [Clostridiales Family XIII bacterium]